MSPDRFRGRVYRCPVCGAEITVLASVAGNFRPRCCNTDMLVKRGQATFYVCPVCGAEIAVLKESAGEFRPRCCNTAMQRAA